MVQSGLINEVEDEVEDEKHFSYFGTLFGEQLPITNTLNDPSSQSKVTSVFSEKTAKTVILLKQILPRPPSILALEIEGFSSCYNFEFKFNDENCQLSNLYSKL